MSRLLLLCLTCCSLTTSFAAEPKLTFGKKQLAAEYYSEGATVGDLNHDGKLDIVSGPYYYEGPDFEKKVAFFAPKAFPNDRGYSNNFFSFVDDFDGDGWADVCVVGLPGTPAFWYRNSGKPGKHFQKQMAFAAVDNESPAYLDLTGDGKKELICSFGKKLGYVTPNRKSPDKAWSFHPISPQGRWQRFTHGLGIGDVNGDKRMDMLTSSGWWEQPKSLAGDPMWKHHPFKFAPGRGGAQMFAYDIDGDGDSDVITSIDAHGWGLKWYENQPKDGGIDFKPHVIMPARAKSDAKVAFSQLHAMALADIDGDGLLDITTGKCYWAHNGGDQGAREPAVVYSFLLRRSSTGAKFIPHRVYNNSGVGRQVTVADVNQDGSADVVAANKKGAYVFLGGKK